MPSNTKFNADWLNIRDNNGHMVQDWCVKVSEFEVECKICKSVIDIRNSGKVQILQHSKGKKHTEKALSAFSCDQSKFVITLSGEGEGSVSLSGVPTNKWNLSASEETARTEILWCLKIASSSYSYASCDDICELLREMFPDSKIAQRMTLGSTKVSYSIAYGLGPYFHNEIVNEVKDSQAYFALCYDEATTDSGKKQLDIHLRYWSLKKEQIEDRFLFSQFLGHSTAAVLKTAIMKVIENSKLDKNKLVMIGSDGPAVNVKLLNDTDEELKSSGHKGLIRVSSCVLHIVHNSFGAGLDFLQDWSVGEFLDAIFRWFHKYPSRAEDMRSLQHLLQLSETLFLRYVSNRWLSMVSVLDRTISQWKTLCHYFLKFIPDNKSTKKLTNTKTYLKIKGMLNNPSTLPRLHFLKSVGDQYQRFLKLMQSEGPLIHILYDELNQLVKQIMGRLVNPDVLKNAFGVKLKNLDLNDSKITLSQKSVDIGHEALTALEELSEKERGDFMSDAQRFLQIVVSFLVSHLPIANSLLRNVQCLHPLNRQNTSSTNAIILVAKGMPQVIVAPEYDTLKTEWKMYASLNVPKEKYISEEGFKNGEHFIRWRRVDHYWGYILRKVDNFGAPKFPILGKLVKAVLTLSHGQAQVERGFSLNKHLATAARATLNISSLNGLRTVLDTVHYYGSPTAIPITPKLITAYQDSRKKYETALREAREVSLLNEKTRKQNEEKLAKRKLKTDGYEDLKKKQKIAEEELARGQDLLQEANDHLLKGCKSKGMKDFRVAHTLLNTGNELVVKAAKQLQLINAKLINTKPKM